MCGAVGKVAEPVKQLQAACDSKGKEADEGRQAQTRLNKPPDALLRLINEGPGAHIRTHAYKYRSQIDKELATLARASSSPRRCG